MNDNVDTQPTNAKARLLTDGLIIAGISSLSYATAFAYEAGFAYVFHYPTALIRVNWGATIPAFGAIFLFALIVFVPVERFGGWLWKKLPDVYKWTLLTLSGYIYFLVTQVVLFGAHIGLSDLLNLLLPASVLVPAILLSRNKGGYANALEFTLSVNANDSLLVYLRSRYGSIVEAIFYLIAASYFVLYTAFGIGYFTARHQMGFFVTESQQPMAILRMYPGVVIASPFNKKAKLLVPPITVLRGRDLDRLQMRYETIGPLRP